MIWLSEPILQPELAIYVENLVPKKRIVESSPSWSIGTPILMKEWVPREYSQEDDRDEDAFLGEFDSII